MKTQLLVLLLRFCATQFFFAQEEDGVVSLSLPVRNSLTFNRYAINPTFSFVREQNKYLSIYNRREWVQFDDAPLTYLASYNGRFAENIGAGIGLFQQNYGVLSTFGAVFNFAYNTRLTRDNNLTFGLNVGAYKSGINTGNVVTNFDDPSLQNVPENFLMTINPGINFGLEFIDFGVSFNNLVAYNLNSSNLVEDNPDSGIQAHIMYTGYMNSRGFFDESKFSGLIRSEFKKDVTIVSALAMITVPKGIWAQAGYNTLYGISAGMGLNITPQIAIEYNIEKGTGAFTNFDSAYSHEVTLAYRFKNNENYDYSSGDEVSGLLSTRTKTKPSKSKISKAQAEANRQKSAERKAQAEAKLLAQQKAREEAEAKAILLAEQKAKEEAQAQANLLAEKKAKEEAEAQEKLLAEQKAKEEAEAQAILLTEQKAREEAKAQAKLLAEQKAREEAEAQANLLVEQKAKEEAEAQAKLLAEQKAKEEAEAQAKLLVEQKAKEEAEAQTKLLAEQKAKEEAEAKAKLLEEQKFQDEQITNPLDELSKAMYALTQQAEESKVRQDGLFSEIDDIVEIKSQDLQDLKEENDLSEQGIAIEPKPFKSISEENIRLKNMIADLDKVIDYRNIIIKELKNLNKEKFDNKKANDTIYLDEVYMFYNRTLDRLTAEQIEAAQAKIKLQLELENIQKATEFERNRRIKRALYNNEEERYAIDRATLKNIKSTTPTGQVFNVEDFDFGEEQSSNIQILKSIDHVNNGYYVVLAVHSDVQKRNDFLTKVYASGRTNVDFFYDVKTSKYFIYYDKFDSIKAANEALKEKGNRPYNKNMSLVKIEN
jgi:type IX secretion system PorP/SprF family membrane protein